MIQFRLSFTPRFSEVKNWALDFTNRFNGFGHKPLKRLSGFEASLNTSLKRGVNERLRAVETASVRFTRGILLPEPTLD